MAKTHSVVNKEDLKKAIKVKGLLGDLLATVIMKVLGLNKLNKMYDAAYDEDSAVFVENCIAYGKNKIDVSQTDLHLIPKTGPLICLFNHPYGGLDALVIIKTILAVRPDMKFVANFMLNKVKPLEPYFLKVNPFEAHKGIYSSTAGLREMYKHLNDGNCLCIFPAGEVSNYQKKSQRIEDRDWPNSIIKFVVKAEVPVVSGFVSGKNSKLFYFLGKIHPLLRTFRLPAELVNKKNETVKLHFSGTLPAKSIRQTKDIQGFGKFLKARTYFLDNNIEKDFKENKKQETEEQVIEAVDKNSLIQDIEKLKKSNLLFSTENYLCFFCDKKDIPNIFEELARLRELSFREVGEGTGKKKDEDEYDKYYKQLFLWDEETSAIVGAYRIGMGADIMEKKGAKGFYVQSLFQIDAKFEDQLQKSMEMGRSFIANEYQRRPLPLFLLWKGIYCITQEHPSYQYLIGPVSISNTYSDKSIALMMEYIKREHSSPEFAGLIKNKIDFEYQVDEKMESILNYIDRDISALDRTIRNLDINHIGIPVLIKKYLSLGGQILSFNVDPMFNNTIDGFLLLDIEQLSQEVLNSYK